METIAWDDSLSIGVPEIDGQHEAVLGLLRAVTEAARAGSGQKELVSAVDKLIEYGAWHFSAEEKFMDQTGYPEAASHKKLHHEYTKKVYFLKVGCVDNTCSMSEVSDFLNDWWINHIKCADMALGERLRAG
jgi:hemerythrin-like metal-binding protein